MANKPTLPTLVNTGNIQAQLTTINSGYRQIEDEFEKMLSREDNSLPNHMLDALDMDGHKVINVEDGTEGADAVNKSQLDTKEDYLGAPVADGMVLASTTEGERFWTSDLNVLTPTLNVAPKDAKYLVVSPHPTLTNEYSLIAGNGIAFDEGPNYLEVSTDLSEINFEDIALTGVPTAPTAAVGTNTTQVATTAFVNAEIANDAPTKTGGGASGNWNINILGNAETVDGYHVAVDEAGTNPNTIYFRTTGGTDPSAAIWGDISGSIVDQTDLYNALVNGTYATGNWNINASSVDGYNVQVDGTGTDPNTIYFKTTGGTISVDWDDVSNTPTTLAGYGITDAFTETESDARFLGINATAVNSDKVDGYNVQVDGTGTDPNTIYFKTTGGEISVDWDNVLNTPTTVAGYGITDVFTETESDARFLGISATAINSDKVDGYHVQVDGTGTDPNTIYLKTTGGTVSVDWVDVSGTPTTIAGYGITDAYTETESDARFLGISATAVNSDKVDGYHVVVDSAGTDPNTIYFRTTGGTDPSAAVWGSITGTLAAQTDLQAALDAKVPYTGATGNVNLGEYGLTTGFLQADLTPTNTLQVGRMQWNDADGTMDLRLKGNNVTLQIGQEQVIRVVNKTGADLLEANYQCVRISGAQGQRPKVALAQANNDANSADTIGIVTETITNNQEGFVTNSGMVSNINTTGSLQGETWLDGDVLYLSGTVAGRLTKVKPQAPTHTVIVGFVVYAHANNGKIFVKVDNGYEIDELHNVKINGIAGNNVLRYNSTLNVWENVAQTTLSVGDANTVDGYHVQVDGTGTDPNTIYFKTTGGGVGVDWEDISNTPTTVSGYGITDAVTTSGNQTIGGTKTFSSTITGSITGNAGTVTNGVYTTGDQTIGGTKTFSSTISGSVSGNAGTATTLQTGRAINAVTFNGSADITVPRVRALDDRTLAPADGSANYVTAYFTSWANDNTSPYADALLFRTWADGSGGNDNLVTFRKNALGMRIWQQTSGSSTAFSSFKDVAWTDGTNATGTWTISTSGNAGTVTNGVYTTGDQTIGGIKTFSTELGVPSFTGPNRFISGTGDGASLSTYNFALSGWNGMAFYNPTVGGAFPTSTTGFVDFRNGFIDMRGSLRAPIFYDSANTAYYLDPNSSVSLSAAGSVILAVGGDRYVQIGSSTNYYYQLKSVGDNFQILEAGTTPRLTISYPSGAVTAATDFRAPVFYDSNDTGFYVDGNFTSRLNNLSLNTVAITSGITGLTSASLYTQYANAGTTNTWYPMTYQRAQHNGGYVTHLNTGLYKSAIEWGSGASGWYAAIGGNDSYPTQAWYLTYDAYIQNSLGYVLTGGSFRAPIFYDLNNTSYLVDAAGTSFLNVVGMNGNLDVYGNQYLRSSFLLLNTAGNDWNFVIDRNGGNNWIVYGGNSVRAPIFYDSNNTGYYVDATSTTSLRTAGSWRSDSAAWDGEFAGKIQYHSNSWYLQAAGQWIFRNASAVDVAVINNAGDLTLNGILVVNSGDNGSYIYMDDADEGSRTIHCNSNRIGFLTQAGGWGSYCSDDGDWISDMSVRAPIFYDTNNTGYYVNPLGTSNLLGNVYIARDGASNDTFGGLEVRENTYAGAGDGEAQDAPGINFHWSMRAAARIYMNGGGNFVLGGQSDITNNRRQLYLSDLIATGNVTAYFSDERLKTKIGDIPNAVNIIQSLNGFRYVNNDTAKEHGYESDAVQIGLSAQEVQAVLPEIVELAGFDIDINSVEKKSKTGENYLTVDYSKIVPVIIEAIKEQQEQINQLKLALNQLKGE
jgi:hypothetical protein